MKRCVSEEDLAAYFCCEFCKSVRMPLVFLPCHARVCHNCRLKFNTPTLCSMCLRSHLEPETGFPIDSASYVFKKLKNINIPPNDVNKTLTAIETQSRTLVKEDAQHYLKNLLHVIDENTEEKIAQIKERREDLTKKILPGGIIFMAVILQETISKNIETEVQNFIKCSKDHLTDAPNTEFSDNTFQRATMVQKFLDEYTTLPRVGFYRGKPRINIHEFFEACPFYVITADETRSFCHFLGIKNELPHKNSFLVGNYVVSVGDQELCVLDKYGFSTIFQTKL